METEIRVYAKDFAYLYTLDDFKELTIDRYHLGVGQMRLTVAKYALSACFLQRGFWLQKAGEREFYAVQQLEIDNEQVTATAYDPHYFAGKHLVLPDKLENGKLNNAQTARKVTGSYDQAAKDWVASSALPMTTAPARQVTVGEDPVTLTADCFSVVGDALDEILGPRLMGVRYAFSPDTGGFVFDTADAVDRTMDNKMGNPPAIFSVQYDNLVNLTYNESDNDTVTTVYIFQGGSNTTPGSSSGSAGSFGETTGGSNTGSLGGTTGSTATGVEVYGDEISGYDRRESILRAEDGDYQQKLDDLLKKTDVSFTAEIHKGESLVYGRDYDVGDIVTAWLELPGVQVVQEKSGRFYDPVLRWVRVDQQITSISEHYTGAEQTLDVTFGTPEKTLPEQLKDVKRAQRATEGNFVKIQATGRL